MLEAVAADRRAGVGRLVFVGTRTVSVGMIGLAGDPAGNLYVGNHLTGNIELYDSANVLVQTIFTNIGGSSLSSLGHDPVANAVWISTGFNQDDIRQYSLPGGDLTVSGRMRRSSLDWT